MANRIFLIAFILSQFASAFLLFLVQPIAAKMLLPVLGGASSVWNTSVFFFQVTLLLGYFYAHLSIKFLNNRQQRILHLFVLGLGMLSLPIAVGKLSAPDEPLLWVLGVLITMVAAPFFALSATAPLFQAWFVQSDHPQRKNPYQLYAASNAGSILALLLYPFVFERLFSTQIQSNIWSISYLCFLGITTIIVGMTWKFSARQKLESSNSEGEPIDQVASISWSQRLRWVAYALIPSSLVLGVTTHISTNIGSIPLFWVIPLALYLLTFVIAFSPYRKKFSKIRLAAGPFVAMTFFAQLVIVNWSIIAILHLGALFILSLSFHSKLVEEAPDPGNLTEFYLFMSFGGVLGASFNAVIAPTIFSTQYEYYIMLGVAMLLLYDKVEKGLPNKFKEFSATLIIIAISTIWFAIEKDKFMSGYWDFVLVFLGLLAILFRAFPKSRTALAKLVLVVWAFILMIGLQAPNLHQDRSFYATLLVYGEQQGTRVFHNLAHGDTVHGLQEQNTEKLVPLSYYHRDSTMGHVFTNRQRKDAIRVGVVGLGVGSLAAYNRPTDHMDFFEIDSAVVELANNPKLFTFLSRAEGEVDVFVGDGRVKLDEYSGPSYDLLVLDAFSSNAIPTFLLTKEAVEIFLSKTRADGLLLFHVSSRTLNLVPILAKICEHLGIHSRVLVYQSTPKNLDSPSPSLWVMITKDDAVINSVEGDWTKIDVGDAPLWTDAHHNILSALK